MKEAFSATLLAFLTLLATLVATGGACAGDTGCVADHPVVADGDAAGFAERFDFFTNYGEYMPRKHCLRTAGGDPDWPWITALIGLNAVVMCGYLRIVWFWLACYRREDSRDRDEKLMQLAWIFGICAACGYGMSTLIFFWPAYRLLALLLAVLAVVTWRFALDLAPFQKAFTAHRLQRELNEALQAERSDLMGMLNSAPVAIVMADEDGLVEAVNQSAIDTFGYTREEILGQPLELLLPGICDAAPSGAASGRRNGGQDFPAEIGLERIVCSGRKKIVAAVNDLTATHEAKRAAAESEARFHSIANSAPLGVWVCDAASECVWFNERWLEYSGMPLEACIRGGWTAIAHPADCRSVERAYRDALQGRERFSLACRLRRHDGDFRWHTAIGTPRWDDEGKFLGLVGVCIDDHDARQLREELLRTNESLQESERQALDAARAKGDFLANMSHEIRTPMNAIIGLTEIVLGSDLDDTQRDYLSTVSSSAESLLQVINDILDFSKIEAGKLEIDEHDFQVRELTADVLKSLGLKAKSTATELACKVAPDVPDVLIGDAGRLRQVLTNLVGNALKFTESGHVYVDVRLAGDATDEPGRLRLRFSVEDTGVGIPCDKLKMIFQEFEQADTSTTREFGGTGLGLAICSKLVAAMGGEIGVDSELGRGSTFAFTIDVGRSDRRITQPWREVIDKLENARVLIVDDSELNLRVLDEMIRAHKVETVTASDGKDALECMEQASAEGRPFSLVISDVGMPDMDGHTLAEEIRKQHGHGVPVVLLSPSGLGPNLSELREWGVTSRLTKPVKQSELLEAMIGALGLAEEVVARAPQAEAAPAAPPTRAAALQPLRILLAEDSVPNQKLALAVLSGEGHEVTVAETGREAFNLSLSSPFDVVLMDIQMPEMDGYQATAAIRDHDKATGYRTPIIAMTAHALDGDREKCLAAGMDDYVTKPIHPDELFAALKRVRDIQPPKPTPYAAADLVKS